MASGLHNDFTNLQERNSQIISDIKNLQTIEKDLFNSLEQNLSQNTMTRAQKEVLIQKINDISRMRENMYYAIGGINNFYKNNISTSATALAQQTNAIDIVEKELNAAKERLKLIEDYKLQKLRLVEINNYYGQRYASNTQLIKIVIYMFVPILILAILFKKDIISVKIFSGLTIVITIIGLVYLINGFYTNYMRDNMDYQEYDWSFDPDTAPKAPSSTSKNSKIDPWAKPDLSNICIGQTCCDTGYVYDPVKNKCIPVSNIRGRVENFVSDIFTKYARSSDNKKPDYTMGDHLPISYAST